MGKSQPQAAVRRKLRAAARLSKSARARNGQPLPPAFFLTDPVRTPDPARIAANLPRGWGVIYRHFGSADRFDVGAKLARTCRRRGLVLLVSADPALAVRIGADGVHWPSAQLRGVRKQGCSFIETSSAHSRIEIAHARRLGLDAALCSTVFESHSPSAGKAMGALRFRRLAADARLPLYALGGIKAANAASVMSKAAGWAAIEAVRDAWGEG
jgi:thiamine-phosphate pyrophosphorylase